MKDGVLPTAGVLNYCHCASDLFLVCISPYANEIDGFPQPVSLFTDQISSRNRFGSFSRLLVATETARLAVHRHTKACRAKPDSGFPNHLIRDSFCPWKEPHHGQAASDGVA